VIHRRAGLDWPGIGDQFLQIVDWQRRMHRECKSAGDQAIDGPKIANSIVGRMRRGERDNDMSAAVAEKERVSIRRVVRDDRATERAASAANILDIGRPQ
jgi:hypothetical protein